MYSRLISVRIRAITPASLWTLLAIVLICGLATSVRLKRIDESLTLDIAHFIEFADTLFTSGHFDYYSRVSSHEFTYAHLPFFAYLLTPALTLFRAFNLYDLYAIKGIIYIADIGAGLCLYYLVLRHYPIRPAALAVMTAWLFSPRVIEASVGQAHFVSVAVLFMLLALLRDKSGWQAGLFWALAVATRNEFVFPASMALLFYLVHRREQSLAFVAGSSVIFLLIVFPFILSDFESLRWAVYGHLEGRGDGLPLFRAFFSVLGLNFPEFLRGGNDWFVRLAVPVAILTGLFDRNYHRALIKVGVIFALSIMVIHSRYLLMPLALGAVFATRRDLIWYFFAWCVIDALGSLRYSNLVDKEIQQLWWLLIAIAIYCAGPISRFVERLLPGKTDFASHGDSDGI